MTMSDAQSETVTIRGLSGGMSPRQHLTVEAVREDGTSFSFEVEARIDADAETEYYRHGGILQMVLRNLIATAPLSPVTPADQEPSDPAS